MKPGIIFFFLFILVLSSCLDTESHHKPTVVKITRKHDEYHYPIPPSYRQPPPSYPWEKDMIANLPKITKEFFRCKGSGLNPEKYDLSDCCSEKHSLPLQDGQEFIYPILIDLMNYIQKETKKKVVITSGHRCPEHNTYVDDSTYNRTSKHLIGAEVSFYVLGMENHPLEIVNLLIDYYKKDQPDFAFFQRYEKSDTNVSTKPWFNKEIFIKLFKEDEGRNFDNRHPYPYISIQVRYDTEKKERVSYTWDKAHNNFLRH